MSLFTVSERRRRVYARKFDHEQARELYSAGEMTRADLARYFGVSEGAIARVVDSDIAERMRERSRKWVTSGSCLDCGVAISWHAERCRAHASARRRESVRVDTLRCRRCGGWFPDEHFHRNKAQASRRGRNRECRACHTVERRGRRRRAALKERAC
jgi:hypothetical protein